MSHVTRIDKVEKQLTPKQMAILWLKETNRYANLYDYIEYLRDQPETLRSLYCLTKQISDATKQTMKGQPDNVIRNVIDRRQRDLCFLFKLHHTVNTHIMLEGRVWSVLFAALVEKLQAITWQYLYRRQIHMIRTQFSMEMPYPLEPETAEMVKAAIENQVTTWEELKEADIINGWLYNYFLDNGARELPKGVYDYHDGKCTPVVNEDNEEEVRKCFKNDTEFERFKSGEDYTKGLADITDAEYTAHYERIVTAIENLVDKGHVESGTMVYLSVPILFLQAVPLIEGDWLDRGVVVLAELQAQLISKGYRVQETGDNHPLARSGFVDESGNEPGYEEMDKLRKQVRARLKKFAGRTKEIGGRTYISFKDYCSWRGRKVKGNLSSDVYAGIKTESWNEWFDTGNEKGQIAGIPVTKLDYWVDENDYLVCPGEVEERLKRRSSLLDTGYKPGSDRIKHTAEDWKEIAGGLLIKLYSFSQAVTILSQRYFDGEEILFSDLRKELSDLVEYIEELITEYNVEVTGKPEEMMDIEKLQQKAHKAVKQQMRYLVDMAKAEALDAMGENQAAAEIYGRYV